MKQIYWLFILLFGSYACKDEKSYDYPIIYTGEAYQIDTSGVTLTGKLADISSSDLIEYGFVWSSSPNPTIENSEKYIIRDKPQTGVISQRITTTLSPNVVYYFRAFARNKGYTSYGENISFQSNGCGGAIIQDFYPQSAYFGDTITIIGSGFSSFEERNIVTINKQACVLLRSTQDTLLILPPASLTQAAPIQVSVYNKSTSTNEKYTPIIPKISSITPESATFGDVITITLEKYQKSFTNVKVFFNNRISNSITFKDNIITAKVPDNLTVPEVPIQEAPIRILFNNNLSILASQTLKLKQVEVTDFSPTSVKSGDIITLNGNNFSPIATNNKVTIGGMNATVISATNTELQVKVPLQQDGAFISRNVSISVKVVNSTKTFSKTLYINDKWFRLKDLPFETYYEEDLNHVTCNNKEYFISERNGLELWCYNPADQTCQSKGQLPNEIGIISGASTFTIGNKIYICCSRDNHWNNLASLWEYDTVLGTWTKKQDMQCKLRVMAFAFSYQNNGYIGGGIADMTKVNDIWSYSAIQNNWNLETTLPSEISSIYYAESVVINQNVYIGLGATQQNPNVVMYYPSNKFFKYDLSQKTWTPVTDFPGNAGYYSIAFKFNETVIAGEASNHAKLYSYDPETNTWSVWEDTIPFQNGSAYGFSVNNKVYLISSSGSQVWEYDPAL